MTGIPDDMRFPSALFTLARQAFADQRAKEAAEDDAKAIAAYDDAMAAASAAWNRLVGQDIEPPRFRTPRIEENRPPGTWPEVRFDMEGQVFRFHKVAGWTPWPGGSVSQAAIITGTSELGGAIVQPRHHWDVMDPQAPVDDGGRWRCIHNLAELGAFLAERT